ncbi:MAG: ATP-binding protein [Selenomonadaceae bacterium]|nr:ATP-binding protein [Selenomonadaceae bacterium]
MQYIERKEYLDFLCRYRDLELIKVVSGVRRCGKSTLFKLFREKLLSEGISESQLITINFEDMDFEHLLEYRALHEYILTKSKDNSQKTTYVFLDEIQRVDGFEKCINSLALRENLDIYITGSNGYFLSGELATLLTGRYVELKMLPLSFKEYCSGPVAKSTISLREKYAKYVRESSFPYAATTLSGKPEEINQYLESLYNTILVKDILTRIQVRDVKILDSMLRYTLKNIGSLITPHKISNSLSSAGRKTDTKTIERYLQSLQDSLVLYQADRYDLKGKEVLKINAKYYVVDIALRYLLTGGAGKDSGHMLENVVYLELLRRGYRVSVGQLPGGEIDFVAEKQGHLSYYQVAESVLSDDVLARELAPLQTLKDNFPKYLLTMDELPVQHDGIQQLNVLEWLCGNI